MKLRSSFPILALLLCVFAVPSALLAQGVKNTNRSTKIFSSILSGSTNLIRSNAANAVISGGWYNRIEAGKSYAVIGGGAFNVSGYLGTVSGGGVNQALGDYSVVSGGYGHTAVGQNASIGGGWTNSASGNYATVSGGQENKAVGSYATVPGGSNNLATNNAFAAGTGAQAIHTGSFVWSDAKTPNNFSSTGSNQFIVRASGGMGINTNDPGSNSLSVNGPVQIGTVQIFTGTGVPTHSAPNGSLYLRTDGINAGETLYLRVAGVWVAK